VTIEEGTLIDYRLYLFGMPMRWQTRIAVWNPPNEFVDEQLQGPYKLWRHTHRFYDDGEGTVIEDQVHYTLPFEPLGNLAHPIVRIQLNHIFAFRQSAVRKHLLSQ
jgi:ligand-binding SRPBCC domain-containing protein